MPIEVRYSGQTVTVRQQSTTVTARSPSYSVDVASVVIDGGVPYSGAYEVTPTQGTQVLPTAMRLLAQDVVINPIPSNYGLITWNGSVLTVS